MTSPIPRAQLQLIITFIRVFSVTHPWRKPTRTALALLIHELEQEFLK